MRESRYSVHDEMLIVDRLGRWRMESIAKGVGRSVSAVQHWCWRHHQSPWSRYLTARRAAFLVGITPQGMSKRIRNGKQRAHRCPGGRSWLIRYEDLHV